MILFIGQLQGSIVCRTRLEGVTSVVVYHSNNPVAAVLQLTPNSHWVSSYTDLEFRSTFDDLGLSRFDVPIEQPVSHSQLPSLQILQGLRGAIHKSDIDHVMVTDAFGQALFIARAYAQSLQISRLRDPDFNTHLQALGLGQSTLNVDSVDQDDYLTGPIVGK